MERTINIIGMTGVFDCPSFPLTNESLKISVKTLNFTNYSKWLLTVKCGKNEKSAFLTETADSITISNDWVKEGNGDTLEFTLEQRNMRGDKVISGGYIIEPLVLQEMNNGTQAIALLQALRAEIAELQKTIEEEKATKTEILRKINAFVDNGVDINFNED